MEVLIAFKVVTPPQSGFVKYVTSMALSLASWVTSIIDPEQYWALPKSYCEVVFVVVVVIQALPEKPLAPSAEPEVETVPKYYPF